ncbi:MAG: hypothetical protein LBN10_05230 [Propionibacteriaceae bacterium]|jgi:hypothetical protein|nr:hypothetical protein [Propionibacteriaceae bacterium]
MINPADAINNAEAAQSKAAKIQRITANEEVRELAKAVNYLASVVVLLAHERTNKK